MPRLFHLESRDSILSLILWGVKVLILIFFFPLQCRRKRFPVFWGNDRKWRRSCFSLIELGANWRPQVRPCCISANEVRDAVKLEEGTFGKVPAASWEGGRIFQVLSLGLVCAESPAALLLLRCLPHCLVLELSSDWVTFWRALCGASPSSSCVLCVLVSVLLKSFSYQGSLLPCFPK